MVKGLSGVSSVLTSKRFIGSRDQNSGSVRRAEKAFLHSELSYRPLTLFFFNTKTRNNRYLNLFKYIFKYISIGSKNLKVGLEGMVETIVIVFQSSFCKQSSFVKICKEISINYFFLF